MAFSGEFLFLFLIKIPSDRLGSYSSRLEMEKTAGRDQGGATPEGGGLLTSCASPQPESIISHPRGEQRTRQQDFICICQPRSLPGRLNHKSPRLPVTKARHSGVAGAPEVRDNRDGRGRGALASPLSSTEPRKATRCDLQMK